MESETMPYISKEEVETHPVTGIVRKKKLTVQGANFERVKKEFDKRWN